MCTQIWIRSDGDNGGLEKRPLIAAAVATCRVPGRDQRKEKMVAVLTRLIMASY